MNTTAKNEIIEVLNRYQDKYSKRDLSIVDSFVDEFFIDDPDTVIIGTGNGEFCKGIDEIKELVFIDWTYWGDFTLDIKDSVISGGEDYASFTCYGTLTKPVNEDIIYKSCADRVSSIISSSISSKEKMAMISKISNYSLHECIVGDGVARPVRFTSSLSKHEGKWKFRNIHFSYPVAPPTDIKLIK